MNYNFDEIIGRENTDCVKYDLRNTIFGTNDVIPMWVADMDFKSPDFVIKALKERLNHEILGYSVRNEGFYTAVMDWFKKRHGTEIERNQISVSPGVVPALSMCTLAYTQPGDKVIIQTPVYSPFFDMVLSNGRQLVCNPLKFANNRYTIDFEDLESKIDAHTKLLFLSNPHNPVGRVWTREELTQLSEFCLKHDILILSDEIHSDLIFKPHNHIPILSISEAIARRSITAIAPSKTFNLAGLHTSVLIIPDQKLHLEYESVLERLHIGSGNLFGNIALDAAYRHGEEWLEQLLNYLEGNLDFTREFINKYLPDIKLVEPEGTYLLWLDFRNMNMSQKELNDFLIHKAKVGLNDGAMFGKDGEGFQRMNIACPRSVLELALNRIKDAMEFMN